MILHQVKAFGSCLKAVNCFEVCSLAISGLDWIYYKSANFETLRKLWSRWNFLPWFWINFNVNIFLLSFGQDTCLHLHNISKSLQCVNIYPIWFNGTLWHCHYCCCYSYFIHYFFFSFCHFNKSTYLNLLFFSPSMSFLVFTFLIAYYNEMCD